MRLLLLTLAIVSAAEFRSEPERAESVSEASAAARNPAAAKPDPEAVLRGRELFRTRCAQCHGAEGKGDGPNARYLKPRPRNLAEEPLKFAAPPGAPMGLSEAGLRRVLRRGLPTTAMPRFTALQEPQLVDLISFLRSLRPSDQPFAADADHGRGAAIYERLGCGKCHGAGGAGDGPSAPELRDDRGARIPSTDLRRPHTFRGGSRPEELRRSIMNGVPGTPMPAYSLAPEEIGELMAYLAGLSLEQ